MDDHNDDHNEDTKVPEAEPPDDKATWPRTAILSLTNPELPSWLVVVAAVVPHGDEIEILLAIDAGHDETRLIEMTESASRDFIAPERPIFPARRLKLRFARPR